jgi:tripartite-type tricarboxylate transporter receptor subunit TctC
MKLLACILMSALLCAAASAQKYPAKPIRILTFGVGGTIDFTSRLMAQGLSPHLGEQVIVDNRNGVIPIEIAAKSPPDGYTLLVSSGVLWLTPYLRDHVSWDPLRDFVPITLLTASTNVLTVHPSVPAQSVRELIALAKSKPGALNYSTSGTGTINHISGELFKSMAGVNIVRVNYKSAGAALSDLLAGQVQVSFLNVAAVAPHLKTGKLKAIAVTGAEPSALLPSLPTMAATGLPGYEAVSRLGAFAPAGTPAAIIARLNEEMIRVLHEPDTSTKFLNGGVEPVGSTPAELTDKMKSEMARLGKVIKEAGIRDE